MDCQMPVMNGFDAVKAIRKLELAHAEHGHPPVRTTIIATTATSSDLNTYLTCGFDGVMRKPINYEKLDEAVAKAQKHVTKLEQKM
jgi:CheY-like chemotaxis protein